MRMKEDRGAEKAWPKPAYNVQLGTRDSLSWVQRPQPQQRPDLLDPPSQETEASSPKNRRRCRLWQRRELCLSRKHKLGNYLKYSTFYQDTHRYRNPDIIRKQQFRSDRFEYDPQTDEFICPNKQRLRYLYTGKYKTDQWVRE
jgi:hypothetical protein